MLQEKPSGTSKMQEKLSAAGLNPDASGKLTAWSLGGYSAPKDPLTGRRGLAALSQEPHPTLNFSASSFGPSGLAADLPVHFFTILTLGLSVSTVIAVSNKS